MYVTMSKSALALATKHCLFRLAHLEAPTMDPDQAVPKRP